jgi:alcohol dehydrogenase YqhD (iron-dependent ADH family)
MQDAKQEMDILSIIRQTKFQNSLGFTARLRIVADGGEATKQCVTKTILTNTAFLSQTEINMAALKAEFNFIDPLKTFHCPTFSCFGSVS